jgi:hypothetical protein
MRRSARGVVAALAMAVLTVTPAQGKNGVEATLTSRVPVGAHAGSVLRLTWTLSSRDDHGRREPFAASGVFVRLLSATGAPARTALAHGGATGYTATVRVPRGGLGGIRIGLHGWSDGPAGREPADVFFPLRNDPFRR